MKRLISLLLAVTLLIAALPAAAAQTGDALSDCRSGDIVTFGAWAQGENGETMPLEWIVLEKKNGYVLLLSRYLVGCEWYAGSAGSWEGSNLQGYLQKEFVPAAFSAEEFARIATTELKNICSTGTYYSEEQAFLMSIEEIEAYLPEAEQRIAEGTPYAKKSLFTRTSTDTSYWWARCGGPDPQNDERHPAFDPAGKITDGKYNNISYGVRPAMIVSVDGPAKDKVSLTEFMGSAAPAKAEPTAEATAEPTAEPTPEPTPEPETPDQMLGRYVTYTYSAEMLLEGAQAALDAGEDPKAVGEGLYLLAEEEDMLEDLDYCFQNAAASRTAEYEKHFEAFEGRNAFYTNDYAMPAGYSPYEVPEISDELLALAGVGSAQFNYPPVVWGEEEFKKQFGRDFASFRPAAPRPGYVCIVAAQGSQEAPETSWLEAYGKGNFWRELDYMISCTVGNLEEEAPVFTGNPQIASEFWVYGLKYSFHGNYGQSAPYVRGFNCTASFEVYEAATHKKIASLTGTNRLGNTIYSWYDYIAKADTPELTGLDSVYDFYGKVSKQLTAERSAAQKDKKITNLNAGSVLNGILTAQTETARDGWQKAIFAAGAADVELAEGILSFNLRAFDPDLASLGKLSEAEDTDLWLEGALENAGRYSLKVELPVEKGAITQRGMNTLTQTVQKAAATARNAFSQRDMTDALTARLFPVIAGGRPTAETVLSADAPAIRRLSGYEAPEGAWAALFAAQNSRRYNAAGGPHELSFEVTGAEPAAFMKQAAKAALDKLAYLPAEERPADTEELLVQILAEQAPAAARNGRSRVTVRFDIDTLAEGRMSEEYTAFVETFGFADAAYELESEAYKLPDSAALPMPRSGRLSGSQKGTSVTFRIPQDGNAAYILMRRTSDDSIAVTCFAEPGRSVRVNVPEGEYTICWAMGPYWFGEEIMFGELGSYNKSDPTRIRSAKYAHTFTLESSSNGDVGFGETDPSSFH